MVDLIVRIGHRDAAEPRRPRAAVADPIVRRVQPGDRIGEARRPGCRSATAGSPARPAGSRSCRSSCRDRTCGRCSRRRPPGSGSARAGSRRWPRGCGRSSRSDRRCCRPGLRTPVLRLKRALLAVGVPMQLVELHHAVTVGVVPAGAPAVVLHGAARLVAAPRQRGLREEAVQRVGQGDLRGVVVRAAGVHRGLAGAEQVVGRRQARRPVAERLDLLAVGRVASSSRLRTAPAAGSGRGRSPARSRPDTWTAASRSGGRRSGGCGRGCSCPAGSRCSSTSRCCSADRDRATAEYGTMPDAEPAAA